MKILMLAMYPIVQPRHGGQLRTRAIFEAYQKSKIEVRYCAIAPRGWYDPMGPDDIVITDEIVKEKKDSYAPDFAAAILASKDGDAVNALTTLIKDFQPDAIHCEQPFVYPLVKQAISKISWKGRIIYGSQNVEYKLREAMLKDAEVDTETKSALIKQLHDIEKALATKANLVAACTQEDAEDLSKMGAKNIVLAPNGIAPPVVDHDNYVSWRDKYVSMGVQHILLFVGSAHGPNLKGFKDLIGYRLGFIPRSTKILIVGGVSGVLETDLKNVPPHVAATFKLRAEILGMVSEADLASLLSLSTCILLPINQGGGSNLKTAEAILSNKPIIASHIAFRGYEQFIDLPQVVFADKQAQFQRAIKENVTLSNEEYKPRDDIKQVTWQYRLKELVELAGDLGND